MTASLLFFMFFAASAVPGRFFSLFYQAHNLNAAEIGLLLSLSALLAMPTTAVLCNLADRLARPSARAHVLLVSHSVSLLFFLLHALALPSCHALSASLRVPFLCVVAALYGASRGPGYPLVSALSISTLRTLYGNDGHVRFGTVRLWGAVSWALVAVPQGALMDYTSLGVGVQYVGYTLFSLLFLAVVARFDDAGPARLTSSTMLLTDEIGGKQDEPCETDALLVSSARGDLSSCDATTPFTPPDTATAEGAHPSSATDDHHHHHAAIATVRNIVLGDGARSVLFFNMCFWLAVGMSQVENLLFLFFANDLHASNLLCGVTIVVTVLFEVPLFAYAPALLRRLGGHRLAIAGALAYVVRVLGYTVVPNAWAVLLLEPLHGVTIAAVQTATVAFVASRVSPRLEASAQAGLDVLRGVGFTLGAAGGGFVSHRYGAAVMYRGTGAIVAIATIAFAVACSFSPERKGESGYVKKEVKSV